MNQRKTAAEAPRSGDLSVHPMTLQLCRLLTDPSGPFSKQPNRGFKRGIDHYSAHRLMIVLASAADQFHEIHGRYPDIVSPTLLNDKIFASKFLRPLRVPQSGNKLLTASFIPAAARELVSVAPIVWHSKVARIPRGDALPAGVYYLKTTHGCDMYRRLRYPISDAEADALDAEFDRFLQTRYGVPKGNWWHGCFQPEVMIEKAIGSSEHSTSINFVVIGGKVVRITAYQKMPDGFRKTNYLADWTPYDNFEVQPADYPTPSQAAKNRMMEAATLIGAKLGYARVDFLLDDDERPYLGEVTFTPGNGLTLMSPQVERELGAMWDWDAMVR